MKGFVKIYKSILCALLIIVIFTAELMYCLHITLMSPYHFSRLMDNDKQLAEFTTLIDEALSEANSSNSKSSLMTTYAYKVFKQADKAWLKEQLYLALTGFHKYTAAGASSLPSLDLTPLKSSIKELLLAEAMRQPQISEKTEKVKSLLTILNNKYLSSII
jgi:hypothetical protein